MVAIGLARRTLAAPNTFAGEALDRAGPHRRDEAWLAARLADPADARGGGQRGGRRSSPASGRGCSRVDELPERPRARAARRRRRRRAVFAADPGDDFPGERRGLRDLAPVLSQADGGLLAHARRAAQLAPPPPLLRELRRADARPPRPATSAACPSCGAEHHPRTDPVVIMLVHDGDRALLGRQAHWPAGPLQRARRVRRAGGEPRGGGRPRGARGDRRRGSPTSRYRSSQPWPFPASLMLGFIARWTPAASPRSRDGELEDVRWFTREEIAAGAAKLPPRQAIARRLIEEWLGARRPTTARAGRRPAELTRPLAARARYARTVEPGEPSTELRA